MQKKYSRQIPVPDKLYFKIGEVSRIVGVPAYVLRFWEGEFSGINPRRTGSGQRLYRRRDVELILLIKKLLYDKKFTIPGAQQYLKDVKNEAPDSLTDEIGAIRQELNNILNLLS